MAAITLTIPDAQVNRVREAFRKASGNPSAGVADLKEWLTATIIQMVKDQEGNTAAETARTTAKAAVDAQIPIT